MRPLVWVGGLLCAVLSVVSCNTPPGTTRCNVGGVERTIQCSEICKEATEARSGAEQEDIRQCAEQDCDKQCE